MGCRWKAGYDSSLASSATVFQHTDVSTLKAVDGTRVGHEPHAIFDPFSRRQVPELSGDAGTLLHNLWVNGHTDRQAQRVSTSENENESGSIDQHTGAHAVDTVGGNGVSLEPRTIAKRTGVMTNFAALQQSDTGSTSDSGGDSGAAWVVSDATTVAKRQLLQSDEVQQKLDMIQAAMTNNLKQSKWLSAFEPLSMSCLMLGRRVPAEAVSEWAAAAWDCDGLGFSWKCLQS